MARKRSSDITAAPLARSLNPPGVFLVRMLIFLTLVAFLAAILHEQLTVSLMTNPGLNGLILGVLGVRHPLCLPPGDAALSRNSLRQRVPYFRSRPRQRARADAAGTDGDACYVTGRACCRSRPPPCDRSWTASARVLDEARDTGRYLVGLLVFLGLLGTFWGLLETIQSVGGVIGALNTSGGASIAVFDELKAGLAAPLKGMGTAFSSSLLGLSGSLVLGFLELQASHAHNRFYNELEGMAVGHHRAHARLRVVHGSGRPAAHVGRVRDAARRRRPDSAAFGMRRSRPEEATAPRSRCGSWLAASISS